MTSNYQVSAGSGQQLPQKLAEVVIPASLMSSTLDLDVIQPWIILQQPLNGFRRNIRILLAGKMKLDYGLGQTGAIGWIQ